MVHCTIIRCELTYAVHTILKEFISCLAHTLERARQIHTFKTADTILAFVIIYNIYNLPHLYITDYVEVFYIEKYNLFYNHSVCFLDAKFLLCYFIEFIVTITVSIKHIKKVRWNKLNAQNIHTHRSRKLYTVLGCYYN